MKAKATALLLADLGVTRSHNRPRDGVVTRIQIVAEIRWRIFWARICNSLLLIGAVAAVIAAVEGWPHPK
jgi:hypothetical protein